MLSSELFALKQERFRLSRQFVNKLCLESCCNDRHTKSDRFYLFNFHLKIINLLASPMLVLDGTKLGGTVNREQDSDRLLQFSNSMKE